MQVENNNFLEERVAKLLLYAYPKAYLAPVRDCLSNKMGKTLPDLVFGWPGYKARVFLELTGSPFPGNAHKQHQRDILTLYAATHSEYEALVLYLQNLAAITSIVPSLIVLERLAKGRLSTLEAQGEVDNIARTSVIPYYAKSSDVNWEKVYQIAQARIRPKQ